MIGAPGLRAADEMPQTTPEGMELRKQTSTRVVYAMPGATMDTYSKVLLVDCYVAFEKNWERDYNRSASFDRRVSTSDMERIKADLAAEFRKIFSEQLTEAGHAVVDEAGPDVLLVRPAIINLRVAAPDIMRAGFSSVIVDSAGAMTLYMELYDSETSAIIARIMDAQADKRGFATKASQGTNKMAADRILRSWADELASHLTEVTEK
jgi:hypothetical protein